MNKNKYIVRYWFIGSVLFAFFPFLAIIFISLINGQNISLERIMGDGEIVLSAFLVISPSLVNNFQNSKKRDMDEKIRKTGEQLFLILLFAAFLLLMAYTSIKVGYEVPVVRIYIASFISLLVSIMISWGNEKYLQNIELMPLKPIS